MKCLLCLNVTSLAYDQVSGIVLVCLEMSLGAKKGHELNIKA